MDPDLDPGAQKHTDHQHCFHQAVAYLNHVELTLTLPHLLPEINILILNPAAREKDFLLKGTVSRDNIFFIVIWIAKVAEPQLSSANRKSENLRTK
jgi:hypothetical protein